MEVSPCRAQVLVIYLGDMRWKWLPLAGLLPFQKHRQQKVAEADSLIAAKRLTKPILFHKALKVKHAWCISRSSCMSKSLLGNDSAFRVCGFPTQESF